jgi:hypothetical protein
MAHVHHHDDGSYYVEMLCTIGVCGALGGVAIVLWYREKLSFLHPSFRLPLLLGGIALLVLVAIRAVVACLRQIGKRVAHARPRTGLGPVAVRGASVPRVPVLLQPAE